MGTALLTAVTGLQAHQQKLANIASNIANVNTVGYRSSRVLFQDFFSQTLLGGSAPIGTFGGTNPQQVGLGVSVASIDVDHTQGSLLATGVASDLAIQGSGFFILSDGVNTGYTRDGSFGINANGALIEPSNGMRVQGYLADPVTGMVNTNVPPTDIIVPIGGVGVVRATTGADLIGNVNSDAAVGDVVDRSFEVVDSLGTERVVNVTFTKTASNTWDWEVTYNGAPLVPAQTGTLAFDANGRLDPTDPASVPTITIPGATLAGGGSTPEDLVFNLDFTAVTQFSGGFDSDGNPLPSDVALQSQNGFPRGVLESFTIGSNGEINGVFSNGLSRSLGQIALATFSNVGGLMRDGNNFFVSTAASGAAQIGIPNSGGRGVVNGGVLENSNVDLGEEFSQLILTQRGYQANARTVTAADTVLQETVNLVR